jgi:hypothetical protein
LKLDPEFSVLRGYGVCLGLSRAVGKTVFQLIRADKNFTGHPKNLKKLEFYSNNKKLPET